jgi:hypothetical protein
MLGLYHRIPVKQEGTVYWCARLGAAVFAVAAGLSFNFGNGLAGAAFLFCAASWSLATTAIWVWFPGALLTALQQHTMDVVAARTRFPDGGEDGMEGYRMWLRYIAGQVGLGVRFKDAPNGTPSALVELYDPHGGIIGIRPR